MAEVIAFRGHDSDYWSDQGFALALRGRNDEAVECFERALEVEPDNLIALNARARLLIEEGRPSEALSFLERACEIEPDVAEVWNNRGIAFSRMGRTRDALESFDEALERAPGDTDIRANRALAYLQAEQYVNALDDLCDIVAERPEWSEPWRYKALVHLHLRQSRQARHAFFHAARRGWASGGSAKKAGMCLFLAMGLGVLIRLGVGEREFTVYRN